MIQLADRADMIGTIEALYPKTRISIDPGEIYRASLANKDLSISAKLAAVDIMKMAKKLRTALGKKRVVKRLQK